MSVIARRVREAVAPLTVTDPRAGQARLYSAGAASAGVIVESRAAEWCDYYLMPYVASSPLESGATCSFMVHAVHDRASWRSVRLALDGAQPGNSQTYNRTPIREWALGDGLYAQQYVARKGFTVIDLKRRGMIFVDDCESDPEWWMEPSRLVREIITRQLEEDSTFVFHAASVVFGNNGVAFVGPKRAGKTTLTMAALEHARAAYIANDRAYVEMEAGTPYVRGWPVTAALGIGTCLASPTMRPLLAGAVPSRYPQPTVQSRLDLDEFRRRDVPAMLKERVKVELTPMEIAHVFGAPLVPRNTLDALIFPRLDADCAQPELRELAPAEAGRLLRGQILTCDGAEYPDWLHLRRASDAETQRRASGFADRLVHAVPAYAMRYWNGAAAAQELRSALAGRNAHLLSGA